MPEAVVKGQLVLKLLRLIDTRMRVLPLKWGQPKIINDLLSAENAKNVQLKGETITNLNFLLTLLDPSMYVHHGPLKKK